jgi:hypothetical protein
MSRGLELFLFTSDAEFANAAVAAGVSGIVIDWESEGKRLRQKYADTEINADTILDLRRVRAAVGARILCRINSVGSGLRREIDAAVAEGADEVLVPMVRAVDEVREVLEYARGRIGVGILVETTDSVRIAAELAALPLARIYVGLNDLAIERDSPSIFSAVLDGTVDRVRRAVRVPFGFAGVTLPELGDPIPCRLLIGELARLRCSFTFLRRSFRRDIVGRDIGLEVPRMRRAIGEAFDRTPGEVARDRAELEQRIIRLEAEVDEAPARARA